MSKAKPQVKRGMGVCGCGRPGVRLSGNEPVCDFCGRIEKRLKGHHDIVHIVAKRWVR